MKTILKKTELIIENLNVEETKTFIDSVEENVIETRYDVILRGSVIIKENLQKPEKPSEAPPFDFSKS